ncbi:hypothetical protein [Pseudomonas sp.]
MAIDSRLTLCSVLFSGFACASGDLPALGWNFRLSFIPVIPTFMF